MEDVLRAFNPWWDGDFSYPGIPRKKYTDILSGLEKTKDVVILSGLRRVGKTTIMQQYIHDLIHRGIDPKRILYVSMDNFALKDYRIHEIVRGFRKVQNLSVRDDVHLFLDEVHFKPDFELELKNLYDLGHSKVFASGSESMTIAMKTPYLTGRDRIVKVKPLDLSEYMEFKGLRISLADEHLMERTAEEYALNGGLPEFVLTQDINYLNTALETILYRDILARTEIKERTGLLEILQMIARNVSTPLSTRKISRVLSRSESTVRNVISLLMESDIVHSTEFYGKYTERKVNPPKLYLADTGFFRVLQERTNIGSIVENLVFIHLKDKKRLDYYRGDKGEIDFIADGIGIEVKYKDRLNERDIMALNQDLDLKDRFIITRSRTPSPSKEIDSIPLWKFLMAPFPIE